jgi:hypothetical protein
MGQMPKQQDLGSYLNPALKQYQADQAGYQQADEANRIDPQQVKPRLWERLAGFALGATQLKDPQNAGAVAGEVVNRRRAGAEQARSTALAPWTQRLQQDKEGLPLAEASARTGYEQGELDLRRAAEERDRFTAVQNADNKQALLDVREEVAQGNIEKAANLLDQKQKELELKKTHDSEWFAMQHAILDLRSRMEDRKAEKAKEGKDHTAQAVGAETAKANALTAAEDKYRKARTVIDTDHPPDDKGQESAEHKEAMAALNDELITDKQRAQDAYSAKSAELGGSGEHQDVASWKGSKAAPAATGATNTKPAAPTSNAQPGTGKILPMSAIEQAAKDNNTSVEEATRQAKLQGYQVQ